MRPARRFPPFCPISTSGGVCYIKTMMDDSQLLERYVKENSQEAFAELVARHLNFVYSAAWRQLRVSLASRWCDCAPFRHNIPRRNSNRDYGRCAQFNGHWHASRERLHHWSDAHPNCRQNRSHYDGIRKNDAAWHCVLTQLSVSPPFFRAQASKTRALALGLQAGQIGDKVIHLSL
jgi:hypothetical protein